jgi:FAD-dependent urate hydroxylase
LEWFVDVSDDYAAADQWTTFVGEGKRVSLMPVANNRFYFFDVPLAVGLENDQPIQSFIQTIL